ncbi:MAG TPA: hypothetical protein PLS49_04015 [Candidatus Woesebacteria bacterium]|nr:hypothetical protein [Candidatus Woesebacteria bacterium]
MNTTFPRLTSRKCYKCGSRLLLVDEQIESVPGQYGPITTSTYNCSNEECQKNTDKELAKMKVQKEEKEIAAQQRLERITLSRKLAKEKKEKAKSIKV